MSFSYTPYSEEEALSVGKSLLPDGIYEAEIYSSKFCHSKSTGAPQIRMELKVYDRSGNNHIITDYLVSHPSFSFKIRHLCSALELLEVYENGKFNETFLTPGKSLQVVIGTSKPKTNIEGKTYGPNNVIRDYMKSGEQPLLVAENKVKKEVKSESKEENAFIDDDLPF